MKENTLITNTFAIMVIGAVLILTFTVMAGCTSSSQSEDATRESLVSMQKAPPADYINELTEIIRENEDPLVREAAIYTLTDIAIRKSETEQIMGLLKDLTVNEPDPIVMSAAYASIDTIRDEYPLPSLGSMNLSVSGDIGKGSVIHITATVESTKDVPKAITGIDYLPDEIELLSTPVFSTELIKGQPRDFTFDLRLKNSGTYEIPMVLFMSTDRTDYQEIAKTIEVKVGETGGSSSIKL
jgi:hypothetical protein